MGQQFLLRTHYLPSLRNLPPNQARVHIQGCQAQDFTLDTHQRADFLEVFWAARVQTLRPPADA